MNIGLDTNILVRYLMNDDPEQADKVEALFDSYENETYFKINDVVVAELDWVLTHVYKYTRKDFIKTINLLFETQNIIFTYPVLIKRACQLYQNSSADFSDCYLGLINDDSGCQTTYTFDKQAAKLSSFTLLS